MANLFNIQSPAKQGITRYPAWGFISAGFKRNIETVINYYRSNPKAVASNHFLVRLLHSISVPQSLNLERYYDNVDSIALNLSMALRMTSAINTGGIFDGIFYGEDSKEILLAVDEPFNFNEAHLDWMNLRPVTVLSHPFSDLGLNIPNGVRTTSETGLSVIKINITMLAVMYRAFRLNESNINTHSELNDLGSVNSHSIMQFIHMYVLPNMLHSHADFVIFNRLSNLQKGSPLGETSRNHPFYLLDYTARLNDIHAGMIYDFNTTNKDFVTILRTVTLLDQDNALGLVNTPDVAPTSQVLWALFLCQLPVISFLFNATNNGTNDRNQQEIINVKRKVKMFSLSSNISRLLPRDINLEVQLEINNILARYV